MNDYDATVLSYSASSTICAKEIFWSCGSWTAYRKWNFGHIVPMSDRSGILGPHSDNHARGKVAE